MNEYRFTFGMKYRDEPHPNCEWVNPDGWLTVVAPSLSIAMAMAGAIVGRSDGENSPYAYAFDYSPEQWGELTRSGKTWDEQYTAGCLAKATFEVVV